MGERLAERHPWLVRVMLLGCVAGLMATVESVPATGFHYVHKEDGPRTELGPYPAGGSYTIRVRANALGAAHERTTDDLVSTIRARIEGTATRASVLLSATNADDYGRDVSQDRTFEGSGLLEFTGDCDTFAAESPCEALLHFNVIRIDQGAEPITVTWSLELSSNEFVKDGPDMVDRPGPWTVEISFQ